jgi:hypothetical protein
MPRSSLGISVRSEARKRAKETRERGRPLFSVFAMLIFPLCVSKVSIEQDHDNDDNDDNDDDNDDNDDDNDDNDDDKHYLPRQARDQ